MTKPVGNAVYETTNTAGAGDIALAGTVMGYRRFRDAFSDNDLLFYSLQQVQRDNDGQVASFSREIGIGKLERGVPDRIQRLHRLDGNSALNLSGAGAEVYCALPAEMEAYGHRAVSANTALTVADYGTVIFVTTGSNDVTITLSPSNMLPPGYHVTILKADSGSGDVIIAPQGGLQINERDSYRATVRYQALRIVWGGVTWFIQTGITKASYSQAIGGADNVLYMSPLLTKQVVDFRKATAADIQAGADDSKWMSSRALKDSQQLCAGWVQFDGTGTLSVTGSYNVSSVTDLASGQYRVNWNRRFANSIYAVVCAARSRNPNPQWGNTLYTAASTRINMVSDQDIVTVSAYGEQS